MQDTEDDASPKPAEVPPGGTPVQSELLTEGDGVPTSRTQAPVSKEPKILWLDAWTNSLADYKLLIADAQRKLKVFSGTDIVMENPLLDINPVESDVWSNIRQGKVTTQAAVDVLDRASPCVRTVGAPEHAKDNGVALSSRSMELLSMEGEEEREKFVTDNKNLPLLQQTVITSLTVLRKDKEEASSVGYLIVGTENSRVLILDSQFQIIKKNGELMGIVIEMESQPCGMVRAGAHPPR
eukprot:gene26663-65941_t